MAPVRDPVDTAIRDIELAYAALMAAILDADTSSDCLRLHRLINVVVTSLEAIGWAAMARADDLCGKKES